MQKFVVFVHQNLTINLLKIENIVKLGIIVIIQENSENYFIIGLSSLAESLYDDNQIKNNTIAKNVNHVLINLRNDANKKKKFLKMKTQIK